MKTRDLYCTGCKKTMPHVFIEMVAGLAKYGCDFCGRHKLVEDN